MKTCTKCGNTKPHDQFRPSEDGKHGLTARCRNCIRADNRESYHRRKQRAKQPPPPSDALTSRDLSTRLNINPVTIGKWVNKGTFPAPIRPHTGSLPALWDKNDVEEWEAQQGPTLDPAECFTVAQLADHLGISPQAVRRWERNGTLPSPARGKTKGKPTVWKCSDIEEWQAWIGTLVGYVEIAAWVWKSDRLVRQWASEHPMPDPATHLGNKPLWEWADIQAWLTDNNLIEWEEESA